MKGQSTEPTSSSEGLSDAAIVEAHDMVHHAEAEQHEYEAAQKRGLTDAAIDAEREAMNQFEHPNKGPVEKAKDMLQKVLPGK